MTSDYRNNHYVPQWYQKRFIPDGQHEFFYRDLAPPSFRDSKGRSHPVNDVRRQGPRRCFFESDLYTRYLGEQPSSEIERIFFGRIDRLGKLAVEAASDFSVKNLLTKNRLNDLLSYMGAQKLRTPKGLGWIALQARSNNRDDILGLMAQNRRMYSAIWSECVWLIADASLSPTRFILSDHPVTVYNRRCGPSSTWCRDFNDPDVLSHATQTIFPLSLDKVLLLTNLSWAVNPYQNPMELRPNPLLARTGIFNAMDVQTERHLDEREVLEINFIIKSRALRYIAAGEKEWLFPERHVSKAQWAEFGNGYLLMPDPRVLNVGRTSYIGFDDGRSYAADEYGRNPWDPLFRAQAGDYERAALYRFQGEFARLYGPARRGRAWEFGKLQDERYSDDWHEDILNLEEEGRRGMRMRPQR